jgi:branched-chain amino acid aminotransferase
MDGEFTDWDDAEVHVLTHGLHYGTGVFEGVRCYDTAEGPAIFRWEEHLDRLYQSAKPYDMDIPYEPAELTEATTELIRRQDLRSCYIRPIAFYGYHQLGVSPGECPVRVAIACWPWGAYLGDDALTKGVRMKVSSWVRHSHNSMPPASKCVSPRSMAPWLSACARWKASVS